MVTAGGATMEIATSTTTRDILGLALLAALSERSSTRTEAVDAVRALWLPWLTPSADGLGPLYNARSCQRCHLKDGRGHPPVDADDSAVSMLIRLSVPSRSKEERALLASGHAAVIPEPTYGTQLQDVAVPGLAAEGKIRITRTEREVVFEDGTKVVLEEPRYAIVDSRYGSLDPQVMMSRRVPPPMIGLGLLEAISASDILAGTDPDDADGDGISGRARWVWSPKHGRVMLGRFGWKAGAASIVDQSAAAMSGDIGVSSPLAPAPWGECTERQQACRTGPHGADAGGFEAPASVMDAIVFYSRNLAVPARRDENDSTVLRGKTLFYRIGCTGCHTPKHATRRDWPIEELAGQLI